MMVLKAQSRNGLFYALLTLALLGASPWRWDKLPLPEGSIELLPESDLATETFRSGYYGIAPKTLAGGKATWQSHRPENLTYRIEIADWAKGERQMKATLMLGKQVVNSGTVRPDSPLSGMVEWNNKADQLSLQLSADHQLSGDEAVVKFYRHQPQWPLWLCILLLWMLRAAWRQPFVIKAAAATPALFLLAAELEVPTNQWHIQLPFLLSFTSVLLALWHLAQSVRLRALRWGTLMLVFSLNLVLSLLALAPLFVLVDLGYPLGETDATAFFQTHLAEAFHYVAEHLSASIAVAAGAALLVHVFALRAASEVAEPKGRFIILAPVLVVCMWFLPKPTSVETIERSAVSYAEELDAYREKLNELKQRRPVLAATAAHDDELLVIVVGESHNKHHSSLYGYHRPTTPHLDELQCAEEIIVFEHAVSNNTHTVSSLQLALSAANLRNNADPTKEVLLVEALEAAGFETHWISNQNQLGLWDNAVSVMAEFCDFQHFVGNGIGIEQLSNRSDTGVLAPLSQHLKQGGKQCFIVHLMGSHGPYDQRSDPQRRYFSGAGTTTEFGAFAHPDIGHYDNSVVQTDYVLQRIIDLVKTKGAPASSLLYFSDHSEDLWEWRGHNSGDFRWSMCEIPVAVWSSAAYTERHGEKMQALKANSRHLFTNDLVFDLALDLAGIRLEGIKTESPAQSDFHLSPSSISLFDGQQPFTSPNNRFYWSWANNQRLDSLGMKNRTGVHRLNTLGAFAAAAHALPGTAVETDLVWTGEALALGHGEDGTMSGAELEQCVAWPGTESIGRWWLDIKNLSAVNAPEVLAYLNRSCFARLKEHFIVESNATDAALLLFRQNGFYTSYYLPSPPAGGEKAWASRIAAHCKVVNYNAVSFDAAHYAAVKTWLEPLLPAHVDYLSWNLNLHLDSPTWKSDVLREPWAADPRMALVLQSLQSPYRL